MSIVPTEQLTRDRVNEKSDISHNVYLSNVKERNIFYCLKFKWSHRVITSHLSFSWIDLSSLQISLICRQSSSALSFFSFQDKSFYRLYKGIILHFYRRAKNLLQFLEREIKISKQRSFLWIERNVAKSTHKPLTDDRFGKSKQTVFENKYAKVYQGVGILFLFF